MATINGFHLLRKSDSFEIERWVNIPARIETQDGTSIVRIDGAKVGFDDGLHIITVTNWTVADPPVNTFLPLNMFLTRITGAEFIAIRRAINTAITNGNQLIPLWYDNVIANRGMDLAASDTISVKASSVSAGIFNQARADVVFANPS